MPARLRSAPMKSRSRWSRPPTARHGDRDRQDRLARPVLAGADGRGRDAEGARRVRPGQSGRRGFRARRDDRRRPASAAPWHRGRNSVAEAADPADLRALRRDRSPLGRGLSRPWRLQGPRTGADAHLRRDPRRRHDLGPARPRRRRLSDRHQVEDGGADEGRPQIHRLQRRRGRQRHLCRPHDHGRRSLRGDRRHDDRRHHRRRHQGLHLHPLRISACRRSR